VTIKAIVDTNVVISGIFWKGPPFRILEAWQEHLCLPKSPYALKALHLREAP
jgi:predicted nucleic acid-binding protein